MARVLAARPEPEAHLLVGALRAEGITAWVQRNGLARIYGLTFGEFATRVMVPDDELEAAQALLAAITADAS